MTKYFCDLCKKELKKSEHERLKINRRISGKRVEIDVMAGIDAVNSGMLCHACIRKIIAE